MVGSGFESRFAIGVVIFCGVTASTALTLFIVPALYQALARYAAPPGAIAAEIAAYERGERQPAE